MSKFVSFRPKTSLSFSGCAWLLPYHLGVIDTWQQRGRLAHAEFLGASSGALAATIAALDLCPKRVCERVLGFAKDSEHRRIGPAGRMTRYVREGLREELPLDAPRLAKGRLKISVTVLPSLRHELIDAGRCHDRDDLIQLLLGSCYIPLYYEKPVYWQGLWLIDGGIRQNQPQTSPHTITVSPLASALIRPEYTPRRRDVLLPHRGRMEELFAAGQKDAERFLLGHWHGSLAGAPLSQQSAVCAWELPLTGEVETII